VEPPLDPELAPDDPPLLELPPPAASVTMIEHVPPAHVSPALHAVPSQQASP
jgi:hypothetical protein